MDNDNPYQPKQPPDFHGPRNRRVCPSDLKKTIKSLKRALRKEEKRADKMAVLRQEIDHLSGLLRGFRNA